MHSSRKVLTELNAAVNLPISKRTQQKLISICKDHSALQIQTDPDKQVAVEIPHYTGANPNVLGLMAALEKQLLPEIHSVILQGSLATNEEIAYSDFDALIVLTNKSLSNPKILLNALVQLQSMYRFVANQDPLQHHGWFVTTEKLLHHHFDDFFPLEIFNHSALLYPNKSTFRLELCLIRDTEAYRHQFYSTIKATEKELLSGQYLKNMYELKSTLSKFMLLPALYVQLRERTGVYKKESFGAAKKDFSESEWEVMDEVSKLRSCWSQEMTAWRKQLITLHPSWSRKIAKRFAPAVPPEVKSELISKSTKMLNFAQLLTERAKSIDGK
jgi:hypothetical protein